MIDRRGFTLIEMMVASAIAGVVLAAAVTASTSLQQSFLRHRELAGLDERAELLEEYFAPFLRQIGQRSVRPWEAIDSACPPAAATCVDEAFHFIELRDGQHLVLAAPWDGNAGVVTIDVVDGVCPLTPANGFPAGPQTVTLLPATTTLPDGTFLPGWQDMRCVPDTGACTCTLTAMPGPTAPTATRLSTSSWGKARLVPGSTTTLSRDVASNELRFARDLDGDGIRETVRLADDVFGLSVSHGLRDDATGIIAFARHLDETRPTALRMLRVELAVGTAVSGPDAGAGITTDGGPIAGRAGKVLRSTKTTVSLPTAAGL